MIKNFRIDKISGAIEVGDVYADLHNCFDFLMFELHVAAKVVRLIFISNHYCAPQFRGQLTLTFSGVDCVIASPGVVAMEQSVVDEIGYKAPLDTDYDWLDAEQHFNPAYHLCFRMIDKSGSEGILRLHSASAWAQWDPMVPA